MRECWTLKIDKQLCVGDALSKRKVHTYWKNKKKRKEKKRERERNQKTKKNGKQQQTTLSIMKMK